MRILAFSLVMLGFAVAPAAAQQAQPTQPGQTPQFAIAVLDTERVLGESNAGRGATEQLRTIARQMADQIGAQERTIQEEARRLNEEQRGLTREQLLSNNALTQRIADNDRRVTALQQTAQSNQRDLGYTQQQALRQLYEQLGPVLNEVMRTRGVVMVLDANAAVQYPPALDLTEEVLTRFNAAVPSIRVELQRAPEPQPTVTQTPAR